MQTIKATSSQGGYPVHIGDGLIDRVCDIVRGVVSGSKALIVTDSNVAPLYGDRCQQAMRQAGFDVSQTVIPAGEGSKSLNQLESLYFAMHAAGLSRTDVLIALGGGVVGDLAGFAAATYLRGVPVVQVPTTLLAQVDASIGGKTGIDLPFGKNMAGAFYPPRAVIADTQSLMTLPPRRLREGMAEVIKYGCILDSNLFDSIQHGDVDLTQMVYRCAQTKVDIVAKDERDTGERMLLNFGHTLGHALEKVTGFAQYTHGEGVAVGMVAAMRLGIRLGITDASALPRLLKVLAQWQLPTSASVPTSQIIAALDADKKRLDGKLHFVLVKQLGESCTYPLTMDELIPLVEEVWQHG